MANVPNVAGVPALLTGFAASAATSLLTSDTGSFLTLAANSSWGLYLNGAPVVTADTVTAFDMKRDYVVADYPLEGGKFETYDKVKIPGMPRVRFTSGMNNANVTALLSSIEAIVGDFNKYDVVTPNAVYRSFNVTHYDYRRSAQNGMGMVTVDVWLQEVQVSVSATATNTSTSATPSVGADPQSPSAADAAYGGPVMSNDAATNTNAGAIPGSNTILPSGVFLGQNVQVPGPQ